jgi:uncharacterized membrane protein
MTSQYPSADESSQILDGVFQDFFSENKHSFGRDIERIIHDEPIIPQQLTEVTRSSSLTKRTEPANIVREHFTPQPSDEEDTSTNTTAAKRRTKSRTWGGIIIVLSLIMIAFSIASLIVTIIYLSRATSWQAIWSLYIVQNAFSVLVALISMFACTRLSRRGLSYFIHFAVMVCSAIIVILQGVLFFAGPKQCEEGNAECVTEILYWFSLGNGIVVVVFFVMYAIVTLGKIIVMRSEDAYVEYNVVATEDSQ